MSLVRLSCVALSLTLVACATESNLGENDAGSFDARAPVSQSYDECGNGMDDDQDGAIDEGCPCALGESQACFSGNYPVRDVGLCRDGMQQCDAPPGIEFGTWGACEADRLPAEQACDGQDGDCDGAIDEGCPCTAGQTQECGVEFVTEPCRGGTQTCGDDGVWSSCEGAIGPSAEVCEDSTDNDCDGLVNEGCGCIPVPERCGDGIDNDCDGAVDEPACASMTDAGMPDGGTPSDAGTPDAGPAPDCTGIPSGWQATALADAPSARSGATAVWTGTEFIIWGGFAGSIANDGRRLDPRSNRWTYMTNGGAPSARRHHNAVWTGSEMIVWGGNNAGALGDGALYDPITDTWRPMSSAGAPSARWEHTMLWTGTELIVWGGRDDTDTTGTGAIYTVATDSWRAISTSGAPGPRRHMEAVWTGSEMIVWGGRARSSSSTFRDGGVYNLDTDTWRTMTTDGAPEWRYDPAFAWTGTEMFLWGGRNVGGAVNNGYVATGFLYDPALDRWRAMSGAGVPEGRTDTGFAWTGEAVIVWGGEFNSLVHSGGNLLPDGAFWDVASETWTAMPTDGAPRGRWSGEWQRNALWTGCSLIVWGGVTSSGLTDTGGIYTP